MPLYGCSRPGSRRNETRKAALALSTGIFILFLSSFTAAAQEATLRAEMAGDVIYADVALDTPRDRDLLSSLEQGLRAEIVFHFKLYRKGGGLLRFLGDRLVDEARPAYQAYRDPFSQTFELTDADGTVTVFESWDAFLSRFFTLEGFPIPVPPEHRDTDLFLLAQVRLRSVKLVPPLNLIGALVPLGQSSTPWARVPVDGPEGS